MQGIWKDTSKNFVNDKLKWYVSNDKLYKQFNDKVWFHEKTGYYSCIGCRGIQKGSTLNLRDLNLQDKEEQIFIVTVNLIKNETEATEKVLAYKNTKNATQLYDFNFLDFYTWVHNWHYFENDHRKYYRALEQRKFWVKDWWDEGYTLSMYYRPKWYNNNAHIVKIEPFEPEGHHEFTWYEESTYLNTNGCSSILNPSYFLEGIKVPNYKVWFLEHLNTLKRFKGTSYKNKEDQTFKQKISQDVYSDRELKQFKHSGIQVTKKITRENLLEDNTERQDQNDDLVGGDWKNYSSIE